MSHTFDIREYKKTLRKQYKALRCAIPERLKQEKDRSIREHIRAMPAYRRCKTLLCYVSTESEVDTRVLIQQALADGKQVAVPYCIEGTRLMNFYLIQSLEELSPRTFGVLEPDPQTCQQLTKFSQSLCILPGISFDQYGYRLGYGGGYYDRFLSKVYSGGTVAGICYYACTRPYLIHGRFDVPCDYLVTENGYKPVKKYKSSGGVKTPPAKRKSRRKRKTP